MKRLNTEIFLNIEEKGYLGKGRIKLLELIDKYGSISRAAKELKMSYKTAWDNIDALNNLSPYPVVVSKSGGKGGGKTYLTEYGKSLIKQYRTLESILTKVSQELSLKLDSTEELLNLYRRLSMKISARNHITARISEIKEDQVNAQITAELSDGQTLRSVITKESLDQLELKVEDEIFMIIKASDVLIALPEEPRISAENRIKGKITRVIKGDVNSEVKISAGNTVITGIVTSESVEKLDLKEGKEVLAVIKASDIIVGKF
ncbi:TOBE domain-containing protein [Persephonella sp.]